MNLAALIVFLEMVGIAATLCLVKWARERRLEREAREAREARAREGTRIL